MAFTTQAKKTRRALLGQGKGHSLLLSIPLNRVAGHQGTSVSLFPSTGSLWGKLLFLKVKDPLPPLSTGSWHNPSVKLSRQGNQEVDLISSFQEMLPLNQFIPSACGLSLLTHYFADVQ